MIMIQKPMRGTHLKVLFSKNSKGQNIKNKKINKYNFFTTYKLNKSVTFHNNFHSWEMWKTFFGKSTLFRRKKKYQTDFLFKIWFFWV